MGNDPIKGVDPDGGWIPGKDANGKVTLTREAGDNRRTLKQNFGKQFAREQWKNLKKLDIGGSGVLTGNRFNNINLTLAETNTYSCTWRGSALSLGANGKVDVNGGIPDAATDDMQLLANFKPVPESQVEAGITVVRFANGFNKASNTFAGFVGGTEHYATYMGRDSHGNMYVFTKNGWSYEWDIQKSNMFFMESPFTGRPNIFRDYGFPTGINGSSPYFNPK